MANIKSAEKRNRPRIKRRARNLFHLTTMRTFVKRVRAALESGDGTSAKSALEAAVATIAKTAQKGVIKKGTASRSVSRLTKAVNRALTPAK